MPGRLPGWRQPVPKTCTSCIPALGPRPRLRRFLALLKKAGGVWFIGGRQWRLVDALENTAAEKEFHAVLSRGGVIGGTAGGASMLADYLVRGGPLSNQEIMAEGYEEGFGFMQGDGDRSVLHAAKSFCRHGPAQARPTRTSSAWGSTRGRRWSSARRNWRSWARTKWSSTTPAKRPTPKRE